MSRNLWTCRRGLTSLRPAFVRRYVGRRARACPRVSGEDGDRVHLRSPSGISPARSASFS